MQPSNNPFLTTIVPQDVTTDFVAELPVGASNAATNRFKRYNNRKIYSLDKSAYVNVGEVADVVRAGLKPTVLDAKGNDITALVLAQALLQTVEENLGQPLVTEKVMTALRQF
jgi:polyhydroxyalkanoate synthesis regulator protein